MAAIPVGFHLEDDRPLAAPDAGHRLVHRGLDRQNIHAVDRGAGNVKAPSAVKEIGSPCGPGHRSAHGVLVVFDHVEDRQLPQFGHVEG